MIANDAEGANHQWTKKALPADSASTSRQAAPLTFQKGKPHSPSVARKTEEKKGRPKQSKQPLQKQNTGACKKWALLELTCIAAATARSSAQRLIQNLLGVQVDALEAPSSAAAAAVFAIARRARCTVQIRGPRGGHF